MENITIRDCYSDGIHVAGGTGTNGSSQVAVRRCRIDNCGRSGARVTAAIGVTFENCDFVNTSGFAGGPNAGIELAPAASCAVSNVNVRGCNFIGNSGVGLLFAAPSAGGQSSVLRCLFDGNGKGGVTLSNAPSCVLVGNRIVNHSGSGYAGISIDKSPRAIVSANLMENNFRGIVVTNAAFVQVTGNNVFGTGLAGVGDGIFLGGPASDDATVNRNSVTKHGNGIQIYTVKRAHVTRNKLELNKLRGMLLSAMSDSLVTANSFATNGLASFGVYEDILLESSSLTNDVTQNVFRRVSRTVRSIRIADAASAGNRVTHNDLGGLNRLEVVAGTLTNWDGSVKNWNK